MDQAQELRNIIKMNKPQTNQLARVITVTSGKGGVGKSNTAVNIAIQLKKMGKRVIILDADFGLANVEVMFGSIPKYNLSDLIYKDKSIKDIITQGPLDIGFISGGSGIEGLTNLSKENIGLLIRNMSELDTLADFIIVDTGAGISDSVIDFLTSSSEILLVMTPEPTSLTDSYSLLKTLGRNPRFTKDINSIKVITNKVASQEEGKKLFSKLNLVVDRFLKIKIEYLGMIPTDEAIEKSVMQQVPVSMQYPASKASSAFRQLALNIASEEEKQEDKKKGILNFFSSYLLKK